MGVEMTQLTLEIQAQIAGAVAVLCLITGAAAWEYATGKRKWLGRATIAGGMLQLVAFSRHAVTEYEVALARVSVPSLEVASGDSGRERTIERIETSDGFRIEREHIAGWRLVSAEERGRATHRSLLQRDEGCQRCSQCDEGCRCEGKGCSCCILGVPGCRICDKCSCESSTNSLAVFGHNF